MLILNNKMFFLLILLYNTLNDVIVNLSNNKIVREIHLICYAGKKIVTVT